jgi:hypothetical protein
MEQQYMITEELEERGYSETAKNILLSKSIELITKAFELEDVKTLESSREALNLYDRGIEIMMNILKRRHSKYVSHVNNFAS